METQKIEVIKTIEKAVSPAIKMEPPQERYESKKAIFRTYQIIYYVLGVIETLLAFRLVLKALAANPTSGFVDLIYTASNPLVMPFAGMFGQNMQELGTIVGGFVYLVIAVGLVALFQMVKPTSPEEVEENV